MAISALHTVFFNYNIAIENNESVECNTKDGIQVDEGPGQTQECEIKVEKDTDW